MRGSCAWAWLLAFGVLGCGATDRGTPTDDVGSDTAAETTPDAHEGAPVNVEAATRAFRLYYRERLHRVITAYNRYGMFGDSTFGINVNQFDYARRGSEIEVIPHTDKNNFIGTATFAVYHAHRIFGSRETELTLLRMLEGLVFFAEVTGHPGLTSRQAQPAWTRVMDGIAGEVRRTRLGEPVAHPASPSADLEAEILDTFYRGLRITYRENPEDAMFSFEPAVRPAQYAIIYSLDERPDFIRLSDCCASWMRVPDGEKWAGAYWQNHNSRDNLPDIGLGYVAARLAAEDATMSTRVREAARRAVEAGHDIGDQIFDHGGNMMTVDETHPYDELVVSGLVRPHGLPENEDLGSLANCPDAYLARAISSDGLSLPVPELPVPGAATVEGMITAGAIDCTAVTRTCTTLDDAFCGLTWDAMDELQLGGLPVLDVIATLEQATPGTAQKLLGAFQGDYDDIVEAMMAIVHYAQATGTGDPDLALAARRAVKSMSDGMRSYADVIWPDPEAPDRVEQRYEAAVFDALAGADVVLADLDDFGLEEERTAAIEAALAFEDTEPWPLMTDEEITTAVEDQLRHLIDQAHPSGRGEAVVQRYREQWGEKPPLRRTPHGYEARTSRTDWHTVEVPRHVRVRDYYLLQALPICETAPNVLDCRWAVLGCERPDLTGDGLVDADDRAQFAAGFRSGHPCGAGDAWCHGLDLDRSGALDDLDQAFLAAADGCHYER
jgi:hypothetical protein